MRNFRELLELDYNFWLVLLVSILMFMLGSFLHSVFVIAVAPMFKSKTIEIQALGFKFVKQRDGKWEYCGHKPSIGFNACNVFDIQKYGVLDSKVMKAMDTLSCVTFTVLDLIFVVFFLILGVNGAINIESEFLATVSMIAGISYAVFGIVRVVISLYVIIKSNMKNTLAGYTQAAISMLRTGVPMEKMDLKSISELGFTKATKYEKVMYFGIYFSYLDASCQYDKMAAAVGEVEQILSPNSNTRLDNMAYAILVYYYSYIYIDPSRAKDYYHRCGDSLAKDKDANSLRIKGFYELNCFGNVEKAKEFAMAAENAVESFSMGSERDYERRCIAKLNDAISHFQGRFRDILTVQLIAFRFFRNVFF